jgi:hypothetical protein
MTEKKILITFAGATHRYPKLNNRIKIVCEQGSSLNYFDQIIGYTDLDLKKDTEYWRKYGNFIENPNNHRGYGYYMWKSYIIKKAMDSINDNDILIFIDAGCTINTYAKKRLEEYVQIVRDSKHGCISFQLALSQQKYTKKALFEYMGTSKEDQQLDQYLSGIIILRKNENTKTIINEWDRISRIPDMINDSRSSSEHPDYIDHRHDQSILSLLFHKYGSVPINDETFFFPDWMKGIDYPFWATRIRS